MMKFWKWETFTPLESLPALQTLVLTAPIESSAWRIAKRFFEYDIAKQTTSFNVLINAPSGNYEIAADIYKILKDCPNTITTIIDGKACGAASLIAMAGNTVLMRSSSTITVNQPILRISKNPEEDATLLKKLNNIYLDAYENKTGLSRVKLDKMMRCNTVIDSERAVLLGFANRIY